MTERESFVCSDCGRRISPAAYRAACPGCGGGLRTRRSR